MERSEIRDWCHNGATRPRIPLRSMRATRAIRRTGKRIVDDRTFRRWGRTAETAGSVSKPGVTLPAARSRVVFRHNPTRRGVCTMNPIALENRYAAHNYEPLPVVLARGEGAHLVGHRRPPLRRHDGGPIRRRATATPIRASSAALTEAGQAPRGAVARLLQRTGSARSSRRSARVSGLDAALAAMNTGGRGGPRPPSRRRAAFGYRVKGIARDPRRDHRGAGPISTAAPPPSWASRREAEYRDGFGPFAPGFRAVAVRRPRRGWSVPFVRRPPPS